jgi:hypothetical protein
MLRRASPARIGDSDSHRSSSSRASANERRPTMGGDLFLRTGGLVRLKYDSTIHFCEAQLSRVAEKVPGWVERLLIPTLESKIRSIVKEEVGHLEKVMDARLEAVNSKIDSLEKRFPAVQEFAEIKARLNDLEKANR